MILAAILSFALAPVSALQDEPQLPACQDVEGRAVDWSAYSQRALILFFHAGKLEYSRHGLKDLVAELRRRPRLLPKLSVVVVSPESQGLEDARELLDGSGISARVVLDPGHLTFQDFPVVAYPSAWCLDTERRVVRVVKGYGPRFAFELGAAARRGAGLIDQGTFENLLAGKETISRTPAQARLLRACRLARKLLVEDRPDRALGVLKDPMAKAPPDADALALLARIQLFQGLPKEAAATAGKLQALAPDHPELPYLECRIALQEGELDEAERAIARLRPHDPEAVLLRGRILEARGNPKEAAALYRKLLEKQVLEGTSASGRK